MGGTSVRLGEESRVREVPARGLFAAAARERFPSKIFCTADLQEFKDKLFLGIVGTRRPTWTSIAWLDTFLEQLSVVKKKVVTVSGYAYGIDRYVFRKSIELGIPTIVFLPGIEEGVVDNSSSYGVFCSEYRLAQNNVRHWHFVKRNRLIAGISQGVVVVQAPLESGSLITANLAEKYGKELFFRVGCARKDYGGLIYLTRSLNARVILNALDVLLPLDEQLYIELLSDVAKKLLAISDLGRIVGFEKLLRFLRRYNLNLFYIFANIKLSIPAKNRIMIELANRDWIVVSRKAIWLDINKVYGNK